MNFNDAIEDSFIWSSNENGIYTTKSGYRWLISQNLQSKSLLVLDLEVKNPREKKLNSSFG
jgi:hypothetical protein